MDNIQWLHDNGGASIKLRLIKEGLIDKEAYDTNKMAGALLQIEKVKTVISYFDQFTDFRSIPYNKLWGLVHNSYERSFP